MKHEGPEVVEAMIQELQTRAKLRCFSRGPRTDTNNIIDTRWVIKRKGDLPTSSIGINNNSTPAKTIRARLTLRRFRDSGKKDVE